MGWQFFCISEQSMEHLKNNNHTVRILIIEDDEEMRSLLKDSIEEGFREFLT